MISSNDDFVVPKPLFAMVRIFIVVLTTRKVLINRDLNNCRTKFPLKKFTKLNDQNSGGGVITLKYSGERNIFIANKC